jgi:hypothetical protein
MDFASLGPPDFSSIRRPGFWERPPGPSNRPSAHPKNRILHANYNAARSRPSRGEWLRSAPLCASRSVLRVARQSGWKRCGELDGVLPQGEMFPNACLLPHHKCSRPTRVQAYTLSALPPKQAARDARFPLRRSERAACVPVAFYESAGSLMSRSSRCRPDSLGWLLDPRTRLWAAFRRRTFSRRCSVRRCPSR